MNISANHLSRTILGGILLALSIAMAGCIDKGDIDHFVNRSLDSGLEVTVTEPVERDFKEIRNEGVLRVITRYSSNSYFLHQGIEKGFEYELVKEFAEEQDLALEVLIVGPGENPYNLLNSGEGDLIAANYTVTPERRQYVKFTRPYNLVDQVTVFSGEIEDPPETIEEIVESGIAISVRRNSSYYNRLSELQDQGHDINLNLLSSEMDTESLLFELARGSIEATVADDNMFRASQTYMDNLVEGPTIAKNDTIAWAIRKNAPELETRMNRFLYKHFRFGSSDSGPKRSTFLNVLRKKYFESSKQVAKLFTPETKVKNSGVISPYDELIKSVADSAGIDWLMIASIVAQETKFNPESKSWAGAIGLMQVLPQYSEVKNEKLLYDAEINLREGVRIISENLRHYSYLDSTDQWAFALATYNAGSGHVADARRLAIDHNNNPNEWKNVSDALLKLMQRKYYKDARFGFCRGIETVRYVREIMNRRKLYENILAMGERNRNNAPGTIGLFN